MTKKEFKIDENTTSTTTDMPINIVKQYNICNCKNNKWSGIKEKPMTAGSLSSSDTGLFIYQVCLECGFIRILNN